MKPSHHNIEYFNCISCNKSFESDSNNGLLCYTCTVKANIKLMNDNKDLINAVINELKSNKLAKSKSDNTSN